MAKKDPLANAGELTTAVVKSDKKYDGPTTPVRLPRLENLGGSGATVDQYEHVTIANENGIETYGVQRGVTVNVPVPVFIQLYEKYGKEITT